MDEAIRQKIVKDMIQHRLEQSRRIVTRCEKRAAHYHVMVAIGMLTLWL